MKYCQACGKRADDSDIVCPDSECRGHLDSHPPVRTPMTAYDIEAISKQVWSRLWKKHIYLITGEFSILMVIGMISLYWTYLAATKEVKDLIVAKIDNEFKTERIRLTISEVASNQTREVITTQIKPEVDKFESQVAKQLSQVTDTTTNAVVAIKQLQEQSEFLSVMLKANNDDRVAFDRLYKWGEDTNYLFRGLAIQALDSIRQSDFYQAPFLTKASPWPSEFGSTNATIEQYKTVYTYWSLQKDGGPEATQPSTLRVKLLYDLSNRNDIDKKDKLPFLAEIYKNERSLRVVSSAGKIINQEPGCDYLPLSTTTILNWWERNKTNYQTISTNLTSKQ